MISKLGPALPIVPTWYWYRWASSSLPPSLLQLSAITTLTSTIGNSKITVCFWRLQLFLINHKLVLNTGKTKCVLFSRSPRNIQPTAHTKILHGIRSETLFFRFANQKATEHTHPHTQTQTFWLVTVCCTSSQVLLFSLTFLYEKSNVPHFVWCLFIMLYCKNCPAAQQVTLFYCIGAF